VREIVTDLRKCPTCGHRHPNGIGARWCGCEDCGLLWTDIPRDRLAPAYLDRLRELEATAGGPS